MNIPIIIYFSFSTHIYTYIYIIHFPHFASMVMVSIVSIYAYILQSLWYPILSSILNWIFGINKQLQRWLLNIYFILHKYLRFKEKHTSYKKRMEWWYWCCYCLHMGKKKKKKRRKKVGVFFFLFFIYFYAYFMLINGHCFLPFNLYHCYYKPDWCLTRRCSLITLCMLFQISKTNCKV
jgi:hypothetical protein